MANVDSARRAVADRAAAIVRGAAPIAEARLRDAAPVRSGETRAKVRARPAPGPRPDCVSLVMRSETRQGDYVDAGTRPHVIRPRRARALRFPVAGRVVFARVVHHPGTRATRWFTDGVREIGPAALREAAARLGGTR